MAGKPTPVPWPLSSAPGAMPQESAGRLIGCYAEPLQKESAPAPVVWRRAPGLTKFATSGQMGFRGAILVGPLVYLAANNELITIDSTGTVVAVGTLTGLKPATFARNNLNPTPQIACVTENGAFVVTDSSIVSWPDADLPQPNSVAFQDGFFFFTIGDRRVFATEINSTSVNALTFTTIQSRASDTLLRAIAYGGLMYFFCTSSCEVFQNSAASIAAPAFPYSRLSVLDIGLIGAAAIAGWEDNFGELLWAANDSGVYHLKSVSGGLSPEKVSPPDLDRLIKAADPTTLRASCYVHAAHKVWVLSGPTWSWEFNLNTQKWNERWSTNAGFISQQWRANGSLSAFGKWLMGSTITGDIIYSDDTSYIEEGVASIFRMESGPVANFPNRIRVGRADFDFVTGVGLVGAAPTDEQPTAWLSWSDDDGVTWTVPAQRPLGARANAKVRVSLTNCGQSGPQGRRWRIEVTDGVYVGFLGSTMSASSRAN